VDGKVHIPNNLCMIFKDLKSLSENIYPNFNNFNVETYTWLKDGAILTTKKDTIACINNFLLDKLSTEAVN